MKKFFPFLIFLAAIISLASCSNIKVTTDYNSAVDFTKFKTFHLYELSDAGESISELNKNRIVSAVKAEMVKKGFTETGDNPDVLVRVVTILTSKKQVTATTNYYGYGGYYRPYSYGYGYGGGSTTYHENEYKDGSIIIDVLDGQNKQLIWTGTGNKEIDKPGGNNVDAKIKDAVELIMEKFPVKGKNPKG